MNDLSRIPVEKQSIVDELVTRLSRVAGVAAVVLGGSFAAGTAHSGSDVDLGIYYSEGNPFSIASIRRIAGKVSTLKPAVVTGYYEWGAWVNGGAWIHTRQGKVDFLYRNLDQILQLIDNSKKGITWHDFDQQPAYGFYSVIYLAETQVCVPLYDPAGIIADLKKKVRVYPPKLKARIIADSLWSAEFTLLHARGFAEKGDVYGTAGCLTRTAANLTQALFALNETYFLTDKNAMTRLGEFTILPAGYVRRVTGILGNPGKTAQELARSVKRMEGVWQSVCRLDGLTYKSNFII